MKQKSIGVLSLILICLSVNSNIYSQVIGLVDVRHGEQVITVGGTNADVSGFTSEAIQIALDAINTRGGGIVKLNPGVYKIIGPVRLSDNTSLIGSGMAFTNILSRAMDRSFINMGFSGSGTFDLPVGEAMCENFKHNPLYTEI